MRRRPALAFLLLAVLLLVAGKRPASSAEVKRVPPLQLEVPFSAVEQDNQRMEEHIRQLESEIQSLQPAKVEPATSSPQQPAAPATQPVADAPATQPAEADPRLALGQAKRQNALLRRELESLIRRHAALKGQPVAERLKKAGPLVMNFYCAEPDGINRIERDFGQPARLVGGVEDYVFYEWRVLHKGLEQFPPRPLVIRADFNPRKQTRRVSWVDVFSPEDRSAADQRLRTYIDSIKPAGKPEPAERVKSPSH